MKTRKFDIFFYSFLSIIFWTFNLIRIFSGVGNEYSSYIWTKKDAFVALWDTFCIAWFGYITSKVIKLICESRKKTK